MSGFNKTDWANQPQFKPATDDARVEKLIKLLKMTTSSNDSEALVAIRMANQLVAQHLGNDWDALLKGKLKIIADPFVNLDTPRYAGPARPTPPRPPRRPDKFDTSSLA